MSDTDPIVLFEKAYADEMAALNERLIAEIALAKARRDMAEASWLVAIRRRVGERLAELRGPHHRSHWIVLLQPIFTDTKTGARVMADIPLPLNRSYTAVITLLNPTTGALEPAKADDVFTATPADTTNVDASVAPFVPPSNATPAQQALAGLPAVTVKWLHDVNPPLTGSVVTLSDSAGNTPDPLSFSMEPAVAAPDQIGVDTADAVFGEVPTPV